MSVEVFEHTADIGVRVTAPSLDLLFAEAGRAVASLAIENLDAIELRVAVTIDLNAENLEGLLIDWVRELIYRLETEHVLLREFSIELSEADRHLHAECRGERADWTRHHPDHELKAITYHQFRLARTAAGWEATMIFDI